MQKKINKISIALSIALVFLGMMGMGQGVAINPALKTLEAWIYPGPPACNAYNEFTDGRKIDVLRPEYLAVYYDRTNANNPDNGHLFEVNSSYTGTGTSATGSSCNYDCNSYSSGSNGNASIVKNNSNSQLITISGSKLGLDKLLQQISATNSNLNSNTWINDYVKTPIINMLNSTGYTGIDIDFEAPNGGWNDLTNNNLKKYGYLINYLYTQLHNMSTARQLNITLPKGISTSVISYLANYVNFDFITLMCYDQNTVSNNKPVAEDSWVEEGIDDILAYIPVNKVIIGMPSYGYHIDQPHPYIPCTSNNVEMEATTVTTIKNDTKKETAGNPLYGGNPRDLLSHERFFTDNFNTKWYYQDVIGMCEKQEFIRSKGIKHIAVWHLGGNDWFNRFDININNNSILDNDYKLASTCLPVTSVVNNTSYPYPGQYYYGTTNKTIDNENNSDHYATISSATGNNNLEFSGYSFTPPTVSNNYVSGIEVIVIGRTENNSSNLGDASYKSELTMQISYNGQDSPPIPFSIYSPHDICKLFGSTTNLMGSGIYISPVNGSFKVKLNHISGANAYITAVFVKPYYSNNPPVVTAEFPITNSSDDAADVFKVNNGTPTFDCTNTHHRFGIYKAVSSEGKYYVNGFRFQNVTIPQGSFINEAYLDMYNNHDRTEMSSTSLLKINFFGEDTDNSSTFTVSHSPSSITSLIPNTNNPYIFTSTKWDVATHNYNDINCTLLPIQCRLIDVKSIIQAIVNKPTWNTNNLYNALSIIAKLEQAPTQTITNSNCVGYSTLEGDGYAKLVIKYTSPPPCNYDPIAEHINNTSNVWSNSSANPKLVYYDIIVEAGGTLTITGTVKFTEQAKIIVMPGGKLIVDGGTLTNLCNNKLWQGIIVQGDKYKSQFQTQYHGIVELKNNATIANAVIGIQTQNYIANSNFGGGIIKAYNASFYNNKTAVKMRKYANYSTNNPMFPDISTFKNCNFIIDNNYLSLNPFEQFINLDYISGIEIMGCRFKNLATNIAPDFSNAGIGIKSDFSSYNIDNFANQTEFQNLQYGIKNTSSLSTNPIKVKNVLFNNNLHGFYANNLDKAWLTANTFKIPDNFTQTNAEVAGTDNTAYGMYLDYCTRYILEGNNFNTVDNAVNNATYGLIINGSGDLAAANSIYNNSFQNIERSATQSQGNNRGYNYDKGLKIHCNDYTSNKHDISVVPVITGGGISQFQGTDASGNTTDDKKRPAGNTFSKFGPTITDFTDINNGGPNFKYFHHNFNNDDTKIWYPKFCNAEPNYTNILRKNTGAEYTIKSEVCPGKALQTGLPEPIPYEPIQLNNIIQQKTAQLNTSKLIYTLWVDNGNTEGLRHDIKISASWDAFELYNKLLLGSPKLSDEVLIDAIKREDVLTPLMLKLILLANPQSTRSDRVWEALLNRSNPLPEAWIDEIKQGLEVISPIENMQADISYYASERNTYLNLLKQCYLSDTTEIGMQQYISLLDNESDIESKYELVFAKISNQDYEGALSTLSSIETMIDREKYPEESDRHANMTNLIPLLITIETSHPRWNDLSENDRNLLINLSETDNTITGSLATACRMALDAGFVYSEPIYLPTDRPLKMSLPIKGKTAVAKELHIKISPNPATDYIAIECNIEGFGTNLRLQITDAMGKLVFEKELGKAQQIIDIREFAKGSYYCTVYNNGKALDTVKFIKK